MGQSGMGGRKSSHCHGLGWGYLVITVAWTMFWLLSEFGCDYGEVLFLTSHGQRVVLMLVFCEIVSVPWDKTKAKL